MKMYFNFEDGYLNDNENYQMYCNNYDYLTLDIKKILLSSFTVKYDFQNIDMEFYLKVEHWKCVFIIQAPNDNEWIERL